MDRAAPPASHTLEQGQHAPTQTAVHRGQRGRVGAREHTLLREEPDADGHILCDSCSKKCVEQAARRQEAGK